MSGNPDIGENLSRIITISDLDCWFGYIYFKNDTETTFLQTLTPNFEGVEIFKQNRTEVDEDGPTVIKQELEPNSDDCIIIKRTKASCSYGLGMSISYY